MSIRYPTTRVAVYATDPEGCLTINNQAAPDLWGHEPALNTALARWRGSPNDGAVATRLKPSTETGRARSAI